VFLSCGDFDGKVIRKETIYKGINKNVPNYMKRWINILKAWPCHIFGGSRPQPNFNNIKTIKEVKKVPGGMLKLLDACGLQLEGSHHSGIDDATNIARAVIKCLESDFEFTQGMVLSTSY